MNPGLLECVDLWASYGGARALRGVNFSLSHGEAVGLYGPNKAGKSSLARCIAGAKLTDRGTIRWRGRDITRCSPAERLSLGISLCPEGRGIYPGMNVHDNLRLGADGLPAAEVKARLDLILSYFPLLAARLGQRSGTL